MPPPPTPALRLKDESPKNRFLAQLSRSEFQSLLPDLSIVELKEQQILYEIGGSIRHVYFPVQGLISLSVLLQSGATAEGGMFGRWGFLGMHLALGSTHSAHQARVEIPGFAWRMAAEKFLATFERNRHFRELILKYVSWRLSMLSQYIACNRIHLLPFRLARLLLTIHDQVGSEEFSMTHEFLAATLGTARSEVAKTAVRFRREGMIDYRRGQIFIRDQRGLEGAACECYRNVRDCFEEMFPRSLED